MRRVIKLSVVDNIAVPDANGIMEAYVEDKEGTGIIHFAGQPRAVVTYDSLGNRVISHLSLGIYDTVEMQKSVENIINAL